MLSPGKGVAVGRRGRRSRGAHIPALVRRGSCRGPLPIWITPEPGGIGRAQGSRGVAHVDLLRGMVEDQNLVGDGRSVPEPTCLAVEGVGHGEVEPDGCMAGDDHISAFAGLLFCPVQIEV